MIEDNLLTIDCLFMIELTCKGEKDVEVGAICIDVTNDKRYDLALKSVVILTNTKESQWRIFKNKNNDKIMYQFCGYMCEHFIKLKEVLGMYSTSLINIFHQHLVTCVYQQIP